MLCSLLNYQSLCPGLGMVLRRLELLVIPFATLPSRNRYHLCMLFFLPIMTAPVRDMPVYCGLLLDRLLNSFLRRVCDSIFNLLFPAHFRLKCVTLSSFQRVACQGVACRHQSNDYILDEHNTIQFMQTKIAGSLTYAAFCLLC